MAIPDSTTVVIPDQIIPPAMNLEQARECVASIHRSMGEVARNIGEVERLVADLHARQGWKALGYETFEECVKKEFNKSRGRAYHMINFVKINKALTDGGANQVSEKQARAMMRFADNPEDVREINKEVQDRTGGKATAKDYDAAVKARQAADLARLQKKATTAKSSRSALSFRNDDDAPTGKAEWCSDCGEHHGPEIDCMGSEPCNGKCPSCCKTA